MYEKCKKFKATVESCKNKLEDYAGATAVNSAYGDTIARIISGMDTAISEVNQFMEILELVGANQEITQEADTETIQRINNENTAAEGLLINDSDYQDLVHQIINYDNNFMIVEAFVAALVNGVSTEIDISEAVHYMTSEERGYVESKYDAASKVLEDLAPKKGSSSSNGNNGKGAGDTYNSYKDYKDDEDDTTALLTEVRQYKHF